MQQILIVDDESGVRSSLGGILKDEGYEVHAVESGEAGLVALESRRYDLVLFYGDRSHLFTLLYRNYR